MQAGNLAGTLDLVFPANIGSVGTCDKVVEVGKVVGDVGDQGWFIYVVYLIDLLEQHKIFKRALMQSLSLNKVKCPMSLRG